ncbi:uncharacterized protein LOC119391104 [Rhipicephalus sanguineus]|uniref:uncharacterized protein LOC119391104 n=1 Tax=Rhipicephalus sanguineus TaxID=34632 RepID=UPI00189359A1|nr:uncharacterized protein LOC119391104 [Rhipicephalus sanguineus]
MESKYAALLALAAVVVLVQPPFCACAINEDLLLSFSKSEIVSDVIPAVPERALNVSYPGGAAVNLGNFLTPAQTAHAPDVNVVGDPGHWYTVILLDPDAPSKSNPKMRHWLHWLVVNVPHNDTTTLTKYAGPTPPPGSGRHRYVFLAYEQKQSGRAQHYERLRQGTGEVQPPGVPRSSGRQSTGGRQLLLRREQVARTALRRCLSLPEGRGCFSAGGHTPPAIFNVLAAKPANIVGSSEGSVDHPRRACGRRGKLGKALNEDETLTPLGYHLAKLPLDPQTGKMIIMASIFSCLDPILTVAASLSFKDAFMVPLGKEKLVDKVKKQFAGDSKSDHIMLVNVFSQWEEAVKHRNGNDFCYANFLSWNTLKMLSNMRQQFAEYLQELNFINSKNIKAREFNQNSDNLKVLQAVICAGLYPNVAKGIFARSKRLMRCSTKTDAKTSLHPKSVNVGAAGFDTQWFVYYTKIRSTRTYLHDITPVYPIPLLLFGGFFRHSGDTITLDDGSPFIATINLWQAFVNNNTKKVLQKGDKLIQLDLAKTLDDIAKNGADYFYNGSFAKELVQEVADNGGVMIEWDLTNYSASWVTPLNRTFKGNLTLYTAPPPGSGGVVAYILGIMDAFRAKEDECLQENVSTLHRFAESCKFGYAKRADLGDPQFVDCEQVLTEMTSTETAETAKGKINDSRTFGNLEYYGYTYGIARHDQGNAHATFWYRDDIVIAVSSTINHPYDSVLSQSSLITARVPR